MQLDSVAVLRNTRNDYKKSPFAAHTQTGLHKLQFSSGNGVLALILSSESELHAFFSSGELADQ